GYSPVINRGYRDDPLALARHADAQTLGSLSIALDVGSQDALVYDTNELAQALRARGLTVALRLDRALTTAFTGGRTPTTTSGSS
ncbi:MAG TPA: hypothetical protein VMT24_05335, partial [Aggregatilineaceae bacterium]|nr:hypothetical protein [Aggregatilineaceae bacterium]